MSQQQGSSERSDRSPLDLLERWYHIPALLGVLAVILWTRLQSYENFVRNGQVYFRGNDPCGIIPFDIFTRFPGGHSAGQFGTPLRLHHRGQHVAREPDHRWQ